MKKGRICKKRVIECNCGETLNINSLKKHIKIKHEKKDVIEFNEEYYNIMYGKIKTYDLLKDYENGFTIFELCEKYSLLATDIYFIFKFNNIKKRTRSEAKKTINYKEKYNKTIKEKYGVDNISQLDFVKKKKIDTMLDNYNRVNNFSDLEIRERAKNNIDYEKTWESIKKTIKLKYGVDKITDIEGVRFKIGEKHSFNYKNIFTEEEKDKIKCRLSLARTKIKYKRISRLELKIQEILNDLNISYKANTVINGYNFDLLFDNNNILEINGDYWHANPKIYSKTDVIIYPNKNLLMASSVWDRDKLKKEKVEKNGYIVNYLWESEIKEMSKQELLEFLIKLVI